MVSMPFNDLRSFMEVLKANGQLVEINRPTRLDLEMPAVMQALMKAQGPAALFTNLDHPSGIPVTGGIIGSLPRIALAMECGEAEITRRMGEAIANPLKPVKVENGAFLENVVTGDDIDLASLPIPVHNAGDGGKYITGGAVVSRDPKTGRQNYSFNRLQVQGRRRFSIMMNFWRHIRRFLEAAEEAGEPLPVCVAIGLDPRVLIAAGVRVDYDEVEIAGALKGSPVEVASCATVPLEVPAQAEIVIEGYIPPGERVPEGPLAEFTGHYGEGYSTPVIEVTAVCHRNNPIFQTIVPASFEHVYLGNVLPREPMLMSFVSHVSPNVKAVHLTPYSGGFMAVIQLDKKNEGEPKNVALAALMTHVNIKIAVVVDPDVDIHDPADILWAVSTRVDAARDIFTVPYAQGMENDPTTDSLGRHTKIAIDATIAGDKAHHYRRVVYPPVDLAQWLE